MYVILVGWYSPESVELTLISVVTLWTHKDQDKYIHLKIYKYIFKFIVRTYMTCDMSKYESWDTGSDFTSAEILDSIYNDLDLGLWELLIKHLH